MLIQAPQKIISGGSSPFQSSPFSASEKTTSPRLFWKSRDPTTPNRLNIENGPFGGKETSPSLTRRSSIERLQRASRVKNSNMFAREQKQEYDPASVPVIERPLAKQVHGNAYGGAGLEGLRTAERARPFGHQRTDSKTSIPVYNPTKSPLKTVANGIPSPSKDQVSPMKSSMSSRSFNPKSSSDADNAIWSEENSADERELPPGRSLHRHAKSVTFDAAPPQINEYEMATPDTSSIGTGSRENSYDSEEEEDEDSYNRGDSADQEDSFDASLEDTDKTPVVGPEDWRHASPATHSSGIVSGCFEDPFDDPEGSPMPDARTRADSLNSNGDPRPLPPLPGMNRRRANSSSVVERVSSSQRNLPSPPNAAFISKADTHDTSSGQMTLEERLRLMMIQDEEPPKTVAEEPGERRTSTSEPRERSSQTPEHEQPIDIYEDEDALDDLPGLGTYQLPARISRESILRKVDGHETFSQDSDYNFSSPGPSSSPGRIVLPDPDTPIPSTEDPSILEEDNADDSVIIKAEPDDDDEVDIYAIAEMYQSSPSRMSEYDENEESVIHHDVSSGNVLESEDLDPTVSNQSPQPQSNNDTKDDHPLTPPDSEPSASNSSNPEKDDTKDSLPAASDLNSNDFRSSLQAYMSPSPPPLPKDAEELKEKRISMQDAHEYLQRPETPRQRQEPTSKPEYDGTGWGPDEEDEIDSGTPESVIHHSITPSPPPALPVIDEQIATIKSSAGSKLKTRPSATPSDIVAMRELRRQVSGETPSIPPIPQRHQNRPSLSIERETSEGGDGETMERNSSFKKKSLTLDIGNDLGLSLDKDFDRVIEAQKVAFNLSSSHPTFFNTGKGQASDSNDVLLCEFHANITPRKQRGYLMRQNTKVVVASSDIDKGTRSAGNSPVKKDRPQSWTVEPWNGQTRRASARSASGSRKRPVTGPVPPLPGQESNVAGLGMVTEESGSTGQPDSGERGRLFVKVIGVKDLDLPLPKSKANQLFMCLISS